MVNSRTQLRIEQAIVAPALMPRPFFLLPDFASDHRLFDEQIREFPHLRTPSWIRPHDGEDLSAYAERFARWLNFPSGAVIGGVGFGAVVALEMARKPYVRDHLGGLVLISGYRSRRAVSMGFKMKAFVNSRVSDKVLRKRLVKTAASVNEDGLNRRAKERLMEMAKRADLEFYRWAVSQTANWRFNGPEVDFANVPVLQIHGKYNRVVPSAGNPSVQLEGGHLVQYTHAPQVNDTIRRWISEL